MSRASQDEYQSGRLWNGFDYINQAWVIDGVYQDCGHPQIGEPMIAFGGQPFEGCSCYGRVHAGEKSERGFNGHHVDCDLADDPIKTNYCSMLCVL